MEDESAIIARQISARLNSTHALRIEFLDVTQNCAQNWLKQSESDFFSPKKRSNCSIYMFIIRSNILVIGFYFMLHKCLFRTNHELNSSR